MNWEAGGVLLLGVAAWIVVSRWVLPRLGIAS